MKTIAQLLEQYTPIEVIGDSQQIIRGIHSDSRKVRPGFIFVAIKGTLVDGHEYIAKAIENGAVALVVDQTAEIAYEGITLIKVADTAEALGYLSSAFYNYPSSQLCLVGITGTNGKTTIATTLYALFESLGYKVGLLSTVCNYVHKEAVPATHTTPDAVELNSLLESMVETGCHYVFMEVSSHAIDQKRIAGLAFNGGVFTNLSRDHLDYHPSFEAYRDTKKSFFDNLPSTAFALVNADDKNGLFMCQNTKAIQKTYSLRSLANFKGKIIEMHFDSTWLTFNDKELNTQFVGRFNAYNLLAVYGVGLLLGKMEEELLVALSSLHAVSGRFQTLHSPKGYTVIVDYAHTPDALDNVLTTIHEVINADKKVITVVGCGGNRDKGKRPLMAKEAARQSNRLVLTSDNPRFEEPQAIIDDMWKGLNSTDQAKTLSIVDRAEAIRAACMMAEPGDVVLVAGKGHEDYQDAKGVKHPFDDKKVVERIFEQQLCS